MFVYSKHGIADVCYKGCEQSEAPLVCHTVAVVEAEGTFTNIENGMTLDDEDMEVDNVFWEYFYYGARDDDITTTINDYHNTGLGDDTVTG